MENLDSKIAKSKKRIEKNKELKEKEVENMFGFLETGSDEPTWWKEFVESEGQKNG